MRTLVGCLLVFAFLGCAQNKFKSLLDAAGGSSVLTASMPPAPGSPPEESLCEAMPSPVRDLDVRGIYVDAANSVIDPLLKEQHDQAVKPVYDQIKILAKWLDVGNSPCVVRGLEDLAQAQALLGKMGSEQAHFERKWMVNGFAMIYSHVQGQARTDQIVKINSWLEGLAFEIIAFSDRYKGPRNNHYFWEGAVTAVVGVLTNNENLRLWGNRVFAFAMEQVQTGGTLPLELARGQKALHYHAHAAAALSLVASVLNLESPQLHHLVDLVLNSLKDPTVMGNLAGVPQAPLSDADLAWLEIYQRRYPRNNVAIFLDTKVYLGHTFFGGSTRRKSPIENPTTPK
jgi:poly(beta-D-mannuronate) lyase